MPTIKSSSNPANTDREVLITGYGPWLGYKENPAWLSTKDLHDTYLSIRTPPENDPRPDDKNSESKEEMTEPRIHIQAIQCAVSYSHVFSLIPLIHGNDPSSPEARAYLDPNGEQPDRETRKGLQGNGQPFPEGYDIVMPAKGRFDLIIHVGVGAKGGIAIEKVGHKRGYQIPDVQSKKAPVCEDQSATSKREDKESEAERSERERFESSQGSKHVSFNEAKKAIRGFGKGYENFDDELMTSNDVTGLVEWLQNECKVENIKQSLDAGRYLCDFIFYCSLAEQKRRNSSSKVQFIHIPPTNEPQSTEECRNVIRKIIWWLVCKDGSSSK